MTVEIRELHIKAVVGTESAIGESPAAPGVDDDEEKREALIAICVERIMQILDKESER